MPYYNFQQDKELGDKAEEYVIKLLHEFGYKSAHRVEGKEPRWDIIIPEVNKTIEVKNDIMGARTGNLAIEMFKKSGEASGIMASESDFWVIFVGADIYMLDRKKLKSYCTNSEHRVTFGGDRDSAQMMLVPIAEITKESFCRKIG